MKTGSSWIMAAALTLASCGQLSEPGRATRESQAANPTQNSVPTKDPIRIAHLSEVTDPILEAATADSTHQVPKLQIAFRAGQDADYMQILRCEPTVRLKTALGQDAREIPMDDPMRIERLEFVWRNALGDTTACRIATLMTARNDFQDISAPSGQFLYIVNPCIFSDNGPAQCSFDLWITAPLTFINTMSQQAADLSQQLANAEARLSATYLRLQAAAKATQKHQAACEQKAAVNQSIRDFWKGVASFAAAGVGAYVGPAVFGPMSAWEGARKGLDIATQIFGKNAPAMPNCPEAESLREKQKSDLSSLNASLNQVLQLRRDLSGIEEKY